MLWRIVPVVNKSLNDPGACVSYQTYNLNIHIMRSVFGVATISHKNKCSTHEIFRTCKPCSVKCRDVYVQLLTGYILSRTYLSEAVGLMENRILKKVNAPNVVTYFANLLAERQLACPHCGCVSTLQRNVLAIHFSFSWLQLKCYWAIATLHSQILWLSSYINALQDIGASYTYNNEFSA